MTKYPNTEKLLALFNANRRALDFSNEDDAAIVRDILLALKKRHAGVDVGRDYLSACSVHAGGDSYHHRTRK